MATTDVRPCRRSGLLHHSGHLKRGLVKRGLLKRGLLKRGLLKRSGLLPRASLVLAALVLAGLALVTTAFQVVPTAAATQQPAATTPDLTAAAPASGTTPSGDAVVVTLWWGDGCPRCEVASEHLTQLAESLPVDVVEREVWHDADERAAFVAEGERLGFEASAVPTLVVGERVWIGYTDAIAADLESALRTAVDGVPPPAGVYGAPGDGTCDQPETTACTADEGSSPVITVPLVGDISLGEHSLLASTIVIGFVDGVNPCSLWAISVLLTIVVRTESRRRVVAVGATFLGVTAAMYALFMAGIYSALTVVGMLGWVQAFVAVIAGVFGVVAVKDYFAFKKGLSFSIPDTAKPGIYRRMRRAAGHARLGPALAATAGLAVAVSLLETPCTAGFPVLWTGLLQANGVGPAQAVGLFGAYMVPFLIDEVIVLALAVGTMRALRMTERHGELLKLVAGVTMLALAGVMALDPGLMENPAAALGVLGGALVAAALVHVVTVRVRRRRTGPQPDGGADEVGGPGGSGTPDGPNEPGDDDGPAGRSRRGRRELVGSEAGD